MSHMQYLHTHLHHIFNIVNPNFHAVMHGLGLAVGENMEKFKACSEREKTEFCCTFKFSFTDL